jgi:hypothetical protein
MMRISIEGNSMQELLENIEAMLGEFDALDNNPEADPKPVLEQYDLTWGKMWALADNYEAAGHSFADLLESHTGARTLREVPIGAWADIAKCVNGQLVVDELNGSLK